MRKLLALIRYESENTAIMAAIVFCTFYDALERIFYFTIHELHKLETAAILCLAITTFIVLFV